jgi:hypothetical protein
LGKASTAAQEDVDGDAHHGEKSERYRQGSPYSGVLFRTPENLLDTTYMGGADYGAMFEVAYRGGGIYAGTQATLVGFGDINGTNPYSGVIFDAATDLFGTPYGGGTNPARGNLTPDLAGTGLGGGVNDAGTAFEIAYTGIGSAGTPTTPVSVDGADGASPNADPIAEPVGNLLDTAYAGGPNDVSAMVEVAYRGGGIYSTASSTLTTLITFNGTDGSQPLAGLTLDAAGNHLRRHQRAKPVLRSHDLRPRGDPVRLDTPGRAGLFAWDR